MSAQRIPLLAGNWKMHTTRAEAEALACGIKAGVSGLQGREVLLAPPFTALETVLRATKNSGILVAAQNLHWEAKGAFTGEVSAAMLKDIGCTHVIVGHSERRQFFGDTDEWVCKKTAAALASGLTPIVCVGETLAQREAGAMQNVIETQVRQGLLGLDAVAIGALVVAYEPVWAIGTGKVATPEQAQEVHALIRQLLAQIAGKEAADSCRILYGGSVKADNVDDLMRQPDIDGALVGGASLQVDSFVRIARFED